MAAAHVLLSHQVSAPVRRWDFLDGAVQHDTPQRVVVPPECGTPGEYSAAFVGGGRDVADGLAS